MEAPNDMQGNAQRDEKVKYCERSARLPKRMWCPRDLKAAHQVRLQTVRAEKSLSPASQVVLSLPAEP